MAKAEPTPEDIEAARAMVAAADAAARGAQKAEVIAKLQPLIDVGLGQENSQVSLPDLIAALRLNYGALASIDNNLPNLAFSTAQVLETLNDRIRSLMALNAAAAPEA